MQWLKEKITLENNTQVDAQAPIIISASRSTDIPAYFMGIGLKIDGRLDISSGQIHLTISHCMCLLKILDA